MTTCAWDGKVVASDTRVSSGGYIVPGEEFQKLHRLPNGDVLAASGRTEEVLKVIQWVIGGMKDSDRPRVKDVDAMVATADGTCFYMQSGLRPFKVTSGFYAIGSGEPYALTALHLGKSAEEAVKIASLFDTRTNDIVVTMTPEAIKKKAKKKA